MKIFLFVSLVVASITTFTSNANAGYDDCMATTAITADVSAKTCADTASDATCQELAGCYLWFLTTSSSCGNFASYYGTTATNKKCCVKDRQNCPPPPGYRDEPTSENIKGTGAGLESAFAPAMNDLFWGYVSTTVRSPNAGRATSIKARLDVCVGSADTDAAIATNNATTCSNQYCGTSYNEYCNATGNNGGTTVTAAVCKDRCECAINGVTDSTCNQL